MNVTILICHKILVMIWFIKWTLLWFWNRLCNLECQKWGDYGHYLRNCSARRKHMQRKGVQPSSQWHEQSKIIMIIIFGIVNFQIKWFYKQ